MREDVADSSENNDQKPDLDAYSTFQPSLYTKPPPPTSEPSPEVKAVAQELEKLAPLLINTINERNFDTTTPVFQNFSPTFRAERGFFSPVDLDLEGFMACFKEMTTEWPEYHCKVLDLTTYVDIDAGLAEVFHNCEITGRPPGIVRPTLNIALFRRDANGDRWLMERLRGARGLDAVNP